MRFPSFYFTLESLILAYTKLTEKYFVVSSGKTGRDLTLIE